MARIRIEKREDGSCVVTVSGRESGRYVIKDATGRDKQELRDAIAYLVGYVTSGKEPTGVG